MVSVGSPRSRRVRSRACPATRGCASIPCSSLNDLEPPQAQLHAPSMLSGSADPTELLPAEASRIADTLPDRPSWVDTWRTPATDCQNAPVAYSHTSTSAVPLVSPYSPAPTYWVGMVKYRMNSWLVPRNWNMAETACADIAQKWDAAGSMEAHSLKAPTSSS